MSEGNLVNMPDFTQEPGTDCISSTKADPCKQAPMGPVRQITADEPYVCIMQMGMRPLLCVPLVVQRPEEVDSGYLVRVVSSAPRALRVLLTLVGPSERLMPHMLKEKIKWISNFPK